MSRLGVERVAKELQRAASTLPWTRAPETTKAITEGQFRRVSRELTWGLTLNK